MSVRRVETHSFALFIENTVLWKVFNEICYFEAEWIADE